MSKYLDGDTLDEARDAIRSYVPIEQVAGQLGIEPDDLRNRLDLPYGAKRQRGGQAISCQLSRTLTHSHLSA